MTEIEFLPERDQHLLKDKLILSKEVGEAMLSKNDRVIEIGAGTGILTERLCQKSGSVMAFEIDEKFSESLDKIKERHPNLKIVYGNALDFSWKGYNKIVSNIPYTLSEAIIQKAIQERIPFLVLIVSDRFKDTLFDEEEKLGFLANLFYDIKLITDVPRRAFFPPPEINSFMISLEKWKKSSQGDDILKSALLKDGKIKNAIIHSFMETGKTKNQSKEMLEKLSIPSDALERPVRTASGKFLIKLREELNSIF